MRIYILTRGRTDRQITLANLPALLQQDTVLVPYADDPPIPEIPDSVWVMPYPTRLKMLGDVRQWVADRHDSWRHGPKFVLIDDDFSFLARKEDDPKHFRKATDVDIIKAFGKLENFLGKYAQVGFVARQHCWMVEKDEYREDTRIAGVLGFNKRALDKHRVKFNRLPTMTDFDACLQLLRAGERNAMICDFAYGQPGSNTPGGCAIYRTIEKQKQGALGLKRLHPDFVRVTEKETKGSWNGEKRVDVVVSWKKAAEAGRDPLMRDWVKEDMRRRRDPK